ncbi:type III pantothenate kinase [Butyrivibrio sp. YAB3001]|uniref:type III pantothenate kinase n=1 Tax=Butyrivibrio sp. YAB3001 TaxID=1520812 RepID=UPI0008F67C6E|nr:type III pantothenate kinase [Butyrivibrio sp. YAB3001]SFB76147.1 type III pantothenate kinase [Butyrivibrio sp. YAB3001]
MSKVLTVDIGNSNIVAGIWSEDKLLFTGRIETKRDYSVEELYKCISEIVLTGPEAKIALSDEKNKQEYEGSILSSVVPEITEKTLVVLEKITGKSPLLMGAFLNAGIDVSGYDNGKLGTDRMVDMAAGAQIAGDAPVMVCDLGTCTTISVVDKDKKFLGGMICPGVQMSLDAQWMRASQLPHLQAAEVNELLGNNTASNMMSGVVAGTGLMISKIAEKIAGDYGLDDMKIVLTGGLGKIVLPWITEQVIYEPDLLLKGLYTIYTANKDII